MAQFLLQKIRKDQEKTCHIQILEYNLNKLDKPKSFFQRSIYFNW